MTASPVGTMTAVVLIIKVGKRKGKRLVLHNRAIRIVGGRQIASQDDVVRVPVKGWRRESYALHRERAALMLDAPGKLKCPVYCSFA